MKREFHKILAMMLALIISLAIIPVGSVDAASETTYGGVDYAPVYNCDFYMGHADLKNAFGTKREKYLEHFVNYGMKEGRQASADFNVTIYKENYEDLRKAFGNNLKSYYLHYINHGKSEGRNAVTLLSPGGAPKATPTPTRKVTPTPTKKVTVTPTKKVTVTPTKKATVTPTKKVTVTPTKKATVTPTKKVTPTPTRANYKNIVNVSYNGSFKKNGGTQENKSSTVDITLARDTTLTFSINGWARVESGISSISYTLNRRPYKKTISVSGANNAIERSYEVNGIILDDLQNGYSFFEFIATDKNGKTYSVGTVTVNVCNNQWGQPYSYRETYTKRKGIRIYNNTNKQTFTIFNESDYTRVFYIENPITLAKKMMEDTVVMLFSLGGRERARQAHRYDEFMELYGMVVGYDSFDDLRIDYPTASPKTLVYKYYKFLGASEGFLSQINNLDDKYYRIDLSETNAGKVIDDTSWITYFNDFYQTYKDYIGENVKECSKLLGDIYKYYYYLDACVCFNGLLHTKDPNEGLKYFNEFNNAITFFAPPGISTLVSLESDCLEAIKNMYDVDLYKDLVADIESNREIHSDVEFLKKLIDDFEKETDKETKKKYAKYILNFVAGTFVN